MRKRLLNSEQEQFLRDHVQGMPSDKLTELLNVHFKTNYSVKQVREFKKTHKLRSGVDTRFKEGDPDMYFKSGNIPPNTRKQFATRMNQGYKEVKVGKSWIREYRLVWERVNGKIPLGYVMVFLDGNHANTAIENLRIVSKAEALILNE